MHLKLKFVWKGTAFHIVFTIRQNFRIPMCDPQRTVEEGEMLLISISSLLSTNVALRKRHAITHSNISSLDAVIIFMNKSNILSSGNVYQSGSFANICCVHFVTVIDLKRGRCLPPYLYRINT